MVVKILIIIEESLLSFEDFYHRFQFNHVSDFLFTTRGDRSQFDVASLTIMISSIEVVANMLTLRSASSTARCPLSLLKCHVELLTITREALQMFFGKQILKFGSLKFIYFSKS